MSLHHFKLQILAFFLAIFPGYFSAYGQSCPVNIDFETGTFTGWKCYIGSVAAVNGTNVISLDETAGPVFDRQTMYTANSGDGVDPYGGFPVNCPNGSKHSIRLGNNSAGTQAEGVSYEFTVPAGQNIYSLIYHYAVVFEDPNHEEFQQPRLEIEITNVTDNKSIDCSSFTFIPYGSLLPGFFESPNPSGNTPVWCKDWSAVSINLDGNAGKTIRLFFKTADCTFKKHFGYAYIDVNSECSSEFVGSTFCKDDTAINLTAPFGYQNYTWFNNNFSKIIGDQQTLSFRPPPPVGSTYAVVVVPYNGYGCIDTLYAKLSDSLRLKANAGDDILSCNMNPVSIGANSIPGVDYSWTPATGLSDPNIANPLAAPAKTTSYFLTINHDGGGCIDMDTVIVTASVIDSSLRLSGSALYCSDSGDSSILIVQPTNSIQWYNDVGTISRATQLNYRVTKTGAYHALLVNNDGCSISTRIQQIVIPLTILSVLSRNEILDVETSCHLQVHGFPLLWVLPPSRSWR